MFVGRQRPGRGPMTVGGPSGAAFRPGAFATWSWGNCVKVVWALREHARDLRGTCRELARDLRDTFSALADAA